MSHSSILRILASSVSVAGKVGDIVRGILSGGDLGIVEKAKNDLQTEADRAAQRCIISSLNKQYPGITIIGEEGDLESAAAEDLISDLNPDVLNLKCPEELINVNDDEICVWVDPLDGTSEFTQGLLEHVTVLIGIAIGKDPVAGVIHQPFYNYKSGGTLGRTIYGLRGAGVHGLTPSTTRLPGRVITTTRSHSTGLVNQVIEACQPTEVLRVGGAGHKVLLVIEGRAHAYVFASAGSKRWDTCAPEAILRELGGELTDMYGNRYNYGKDVAPNNSKGVLATVGPSDHAFYVEKVSGIIPGLL